MRRSIALVLFAAGVAGCAPTDGSAPRSQFATGAGGARQCFQPNQVINFRDGDAQQVYLRVLGGAVFQASAGGCLDIGSTNAMTIVPSMGISDRLCVGDSARITVLNPSIDRGPCSARIVRSLSEAEVEALPSRQRP